MSAELKLVEDREIKLDLACGQVPRDGFEGVDLRAPNAKHKLDLLKFPWPWPDSSVSEMHCSHYMEHIPMREIRGGQDLLFAFMDECWRVLKPDAFMTVIVPSARSNRAFQDPTHRRFIVAETFLYFSKDWRELNKLDHYPVSCNFGVDVVPTIPAEISLRHPDVQAEYINSRWNATYDWVAKLKAIK